MPEESGERVSGFGGAPITFSGAWLFFPRRGASLHCAHRALSLFGRVRPLAAERRVEYPGVLLLGEHEDLEAAAVADYRVPVTGQRQAALTKSPAYSSRADYLADAAPSR